MPPVIPAADRKLLVFVAVFVILVITGLALLSSDPEEDIHFPSTYSAKSHGAKAAYLLLQESGYDVQRWQDRPANLPKEGDGFLLILAEPFYSFDKSDQQALQRFVASGGRLLATGFSGGMMLPEEKVSGTAKHAVVVSYRVGKGEILWWGSSSPLNNVGITRGSNLELFLNSIGPRSTHILWDEYFHGSRRSVLSQPWGPALAWGGIQFGVVCLAIVFGFSRRSGPIRPLAQVSRLSPLEFVETLGGLYHRAQASPAALETMYQRFRYLLGKRLGLRNDITVEQMVRSARERLGYRDSDFLKVLDACEAATQNPDLRDSEALRLIQSLHEHANKLELSGKSRQENK